MKGITVEIVQDTDPINPREDAIGCCLGTMVCWHRRYRLGEKHGYEMPSDFEAEWNNDNAVILPLYLYDHSGITMRTSPFSCPWDSGQVGVIYVSHEKIIKEYGALNEDTLKKATDCLVAEVEVYDQYLTGDVYGYVVKKVTQCKGCKDMEAEIVDSCFGFYGDDVKENGMIENIDKKYRKALEACGK